MPLNSFFREIKKDLPQEKPEESDAINEEVPDKLTEPGPEEKESDDETIMDLKVMIENSNQNLRSDPTQFTILSILGQGSFGKVYMVRKDVGYKNGEYFAMKVLKKATLKVRDRLRTKMERDILADIRHPFIVQLHFAFQTEGKLFLVIDLVRGGDLFFRLSKEIMFTEDDVKFYLAEIAMALDHLHKCGIIYRDLKPENILLQADGHIKLTDFGLCKESIEDEKRTFSFCGTIEYMAPEVITRKGHGPAADWWSFAVMMYEMLSGSLPFHAQNRKETMNMILRARLPMPYSFSPNSQKILRLLFKRNPETRLGAKNGLEEIKLQPFFQSIDFVKLYKKQIESPYKPAIPKDVNGNFFFKDQLSVQCSPEISSANTQLFKGFSFVGSSMTDEQAYKKKNSKTTTEEILGFLPVRTSNIFNDYNVLEIIGQGSFAIVHRAVNRTNGQTYAIKIVDRSKRDCREEIDILLRYSEHPNIVTLRDVYATSENYFLIMEYLRGGELLTRINKQKSYSEKEAAALMEVITTTVAYMHEHGVVHRDLKPDNIMFTDDSGKPDTVRIVDFGFAKQIRAENGLLMTPCYTSNYVAPEVLKKQGYDAACDIWSLGTVLYSMISGTTPYMNNDTEDSNVIHTRITSGQLNLTNGVWAKVTNEAKNLISSMMDINPSKRISSDDILKHHWITNKSELPDIRLQQESWKLKDAMKIMFSAFNKGNDVKTLSSVNNSLILKKRADKRSNTKT